MGADIISSNSCKLREFFMEICFLGGNSMFLVIAAFTYAFTYHFLCKSMGWFPYDDGLRLEGVKDVF